MAKESHMEAHTFVGLCYIRGQPDLHMEFWVSKGHTGFLLGKGPCYFSFLYKESTHYSHRTNTGYWERKQCLLRETVITVFLEVSIASSSGKELLSHLERAHEGFIHTHHGACIVKLATVVGCRKQSD